VLRPIVHAALHVLVPGAVAGLFWRARWLRAWGVLVLTNLVDVDHLLADPLFDPNRCSIGTHPLHTWPAVALWAALAAWSPTRLVGAGLCIHMLLDAIDCGFMG
jgi:hypothetical protein